MNQRRIFGYLLGIFLLLLIVYILLAAVEGTSSFIVVYREFRAIIKNDVFDRIMQYDPELGWVYKKKLKTRNLWVSGDLFETNSLGFRNSNEFTPNRPPATTRIMCVGDSMTESSGVSNAQSWPSVFATLNPNTEAVNMGTAMYGIEQAYLRYKRDGSLLEHNVVFFCFTSADFTRINWDCSDPGRPCLKTENGQVLFYNIPVPKEHSHFTGKTGWIKPLSFMFQRLRFFEIARKPLRAKEALIKEPGFEERMAIALNLFQKVQELAAERGARVYFIYLPAWQDYTAKVGIKERAYLAEHMEKANLVFIDLTRHLSQLQYDEVGALYLTRANAPLCPTVEGHYSTRGNAYVALLLSRLLTGNYK